MKSRGGRTKRRTNNVCTVQLAPSFCSSWRYRFLNFTHSVRWGCRARGSCTLPISLSLPPPAPSSPFAAAFTELSPGPARSSPRRAPLLFYLARTSFCFTLSLSPRLIICAFCRSRTAIVRAGEPLEPDSFARPRRTGDRGESRERRGGFGHPNPVKRRGENAMVKIKKRHNKGVKVDTIERENGDVARVIYFYSQPSPPPPLAHGGTYRPIVFLEWRRKGATDGSTLAMT